MKATLKQLRATTANPAVSIFIKTHRTHPENEQDAIALKNQLKLAHERISEEYDKRTADAVLEQIEAQTNELDHNYNLDVLAIYATQDNAQLLRLPFKAKERVIIGKKFATRDLMRDMSEAVHYYVLAITSESARLLEGVNNQLVKEIEGSSIRQENMNELSFPINNTSLPSGSRADRTGSSDDHSYLKEFMNRVDKSLQQVYKTAPLPVILVGDSRTMGFYEQVSDNSAIFIGKVDHIAQLKEGNAQDIIDGVQAVVEEKRNARYAQALSELEKARNEKMVRNDLQKIYRSAVEGNAVTLLVRQGYSVPAIIDEEKATLLIADSKRDEGTTDDAVAEVIEIISHHGGEVVFVPKAKMSEKEPIALITRY